ncbi:MAG TPA: hypothetical protein VL098_07785 [Flavipsychrobacter sp.]|nr:hypothetical protein [Flavipsychrobacter sp.]
MSRQLKLKVYGDGDWMLNSDANAMLDAFQGEFFEINTEKLLLYMMETQADTIRVHTTYDFTKRMTALIIKCVKANTERFHDIDGEDYVLQHINPVTQILHLDTLNNTIT